jgi:hypothetical protein
MKKLKKNLIPLIALLASPSMCFADVLGQGQIYNFNPLQSLVINIAFAIGAAFLLTSALVFYKASTSPGYYKKSTALWLLVAGSLFFSITYVACILSRSVLISTPLDVSGIAINSQLATMQINGNAGIYKIFPASTVKTIVGLIMLIGWYSLTKAIYHLGRSGYMQEKGHIKSFFSHSAAAVLAINITTVGPWFLSWFSIFPK